MKRNVLETSIEALLTTKVTQIKGSFKHEIGKCALGVIATALDIDITDDNDDPYEDLMSFGFDLVISKNSINSWLYQVIYRLNDTGHTFAEIAQWMRDNVPVEDEDDIDGELVNLIEQEQVLI